MRIAHHRHQLFDVHEADRVIEMPATKWKPGVPRFQRLLHVLFETFFEIEEDDFAARRHDIAHDAPPQIERVHEQIAAERRDFIRLLALIEDEPQFLLAVRQLRRGHWFDPKELSQNEVGRFVQKPDDRPKEKVKSAQRPNEHERHRQRIGDGQVFGREFAEDNVEESDAKERQRDRDRGDQRMRMNSHERESRLKQVRQKLLADPAEGETGQRHTELRGGEISVEMPADMLDEGGAQIPFVHERVQLTDAHFHDGEFARDEKPIQDHQSRDRRQLEQEQPGRVPVFDNCVSHEGRRKQSG